MSARAAVERSESRVQSSAAAPARDGLEGSCGVLRQDQVVPAQLWSARKQSTRAGGENPAPLRPSPPSVLEASAT